MSKNKGVKLTRMSKESEAADPDAKLTAAATTEAEATAKKNYMLTLFKAPSGIDLSKAKRKNMPSMIKPGDIPIFTEENQAVLICKVIEGVKSFKSTVKGICIHVKLANGDERLLPCTGAIRQALVPGIEADDAPKLIKAVGELKGNVYAFKRLPNTMNKQYNKEQFIFDIYELDSKIIP
jgi:hypothetical protein